MFLFYLAGKRETNYSPLNYGSLYLLYTSVFQTFIAGNLLCFLENVNTRGKN